MRMVQQELFPNQANFYHGKYKPVILTAECELTVSDYLIQTVIASCLWNAVGRPELNCQIDEKELVFRNKSRPFCNPSTVTRVSFKNGVPGVLFIKCKNDMGDLYSFERN